MIRSERIGRRPAADAVLQVRAIMAGRMAQWPKPAVAATVVDDAHAVHALSGRKGAVRRALR
jgi:hypothetical protein